MTLSISPDEFAALAAKVFALKQANVISLAHLHAPAVSVREQAGLLAAAAPGTGISTFRALTADSPNLLTTVARFLALLELFREGAVGFEQLTLLGELTCVGSAPMMESPSPTNSTTATSGPTSGPGARDDRSGPPDRGREAEILTVLLAQDVSGEVEALLLLAEDPISEDALAEAIDVPRSVIEEVSG